MCPQFFPDLLFPGTCPVFVGTNNLVVSAVPEISSQVGVGNLGRDFRLEIRTQIA